MNVLLILDLITLWHLFQTQLFDRFCNYRVFETWIAVNLILKALQAYFNKKKTETWQKLAFSIPIDVAFVSRTSELPDISTQSSTKVYQESHKDKFFCAKMRYESSEVDFLWGLRRTLLPVLFIDYTIEVFWCKKLWQPFH